MTNNESKQASAEVTELPFRGQAMNTLPDEQMISSRKPEYAYRIAAAAAALFLLLTWISA